MAKRAARGFDGGQWRDMLAASAAWLDRHVEAINAINVFPVPDGDTGTNMQLTLRAALGEAGRCPGDHAGDMARSLAKGALMGARGNAGVILSQIMRGMANSLGGKRRCSGRDFADALVAGSDSAYRAVSEPVEGTILTVARQSADAANAAAERKGSAVADVLAAAVDAAKAAVADTPNLLPVLAEAGVVDSGGQGLYIVLEGAMRHLRGEDVATIALPSRDIGAIRAGWQPAVEAAHGAGAAFGYCTEFVVVGVTADAEQLRMRLNEMGDSVIVVHDGDAVRVHLHVADPGPALSLGASVGRLRNAKIDDMQAQYAAAHGATPAEVAAGEIRAEAPPRIGVVAVAAGEGLTRVLRSVGATAVVAGGQTMNPSAQELIDGVRACGSPEAIILPNNENIVFAARQALELMEAPARVVPTNSVPQGIAALLAFDAARTIDENVEAMTGAARSVRTAEVTRAVRDAAFKRVPVRAGQAIALIEGELAAAAESLDDVAMRALELMEPQEGALATIYTGAGVTAEGAAALVARIGEAFPQLEVDVVEGGQPHYAYIISLE